MCRGLALLRRLAVPAAVVCAASPPPLVAQTGAAIPAPGARLRVWSPDLRDRAVVGALLAVDSARLTLERPDGARFVFPWARVDSVQVSRGREWGRGRRGALLGALAGGALLATLAGASTGEGEVIDPAAAAGVAFVAGALGGALVGGMIGSSRARERWESVPSWPRLGTRGPSPGLPVGVAIARIGFR